MLASIVIPGFNEEATISELYRRLSAKSAILAFGLLLEKVPLLIFSALSVYLSLTSVQDLGEALSYQAVH